MRTLYSTYCLAVLSLSLVVSGCSQEPTKPADVAAETTPAIFNAAGAPTVQFSVPDMMCPESCAVKAKEILASQPGVKDVRIDFETKTATVAIEEGTFDPDATLTALTDRFEQATLISGAVAKPPQATTAVH